MALASRRALLGSMLAVGATALAAPKVFATVAPAPIKALKFHNLHTGENLQAVFWANGRVIDEGYRRINWILRDHRAESQTDMDVDLLHLLFDLNRSLDTAEPFKIISGYRTAETNAMLRGRSSGVAQNSYHVRAKAIDIRVDGVGCQHLRNTALGLEKGGVGLYTNSDFVHVDTGPVRTWGS